MPDITLRNVMLHASSAVMALLLALPAHAGKAEKSKSADADTRAFIETSHLIARERVGVFALEGASYDEKTKYAGAGFRYALPGHQETRFDIFVYPAGRANQQQAIESGMVEFKAGLEQAQRAGSTKDLEYISEDAFPLGEPTPSNEAAPDLSAMDEARQLAAIASTQTVGKRLRMQNTMVSGGFPMYSNGYLFYKNLYFFKVRVSAMRERIDSADFQVLADNAARTLVQAIEVANVGGCSNQVIELPANADTDSTAEILVRRAAELLDENCFESDAKAEIGKKSEHARVVEIRFDANDWKAK